MQVYDVISHGIFSWNMCLLYTNPQTKGLKCCVHSELFKSQNLRARNCHQGSADLVFWLSYGTDSCQFLSYISPGMKTQAIIPFIVLSFL